MKNTLFLLLFIPFFGLAQQDTTWSYWERRDSVFFKVTKSLYESGRIITEEEPIGNDTSELAMSIMSPLYFAADDMAGNALRIARLPRFFSQVTASSAQLQSLVGYNYYEATDRLLGDQFIPTGSSTAATIRVDGGAPIAASIRRNPAGRLVFRQGAQNFVLDIVSRNWLRIRRYQGTETLATDAVIVDLFQEAPGRWVSIDLKYILRF